MVPYILLLAIPLAPATATPASNDQTLVDRTSNSAGPITKCNVNDDCRAITGHWRFRKDCQRECFCKREENGETCEGRCQHVYGWNLPMWVCKPIYNDYSTGPVKNPWKQDPMDKEFWYPWKNHDFGD